jgi:hypothetical protein
MLKINAYNINTQHTLQESGYYTSSAGRKPTRIEYIHNLPEYDGITLFADEFLFSPIVDQVKSKYKIGWCQESPAIKPFVYEKIRDVAHKFDFIFTFHPDLLNENPDKYKKALTASSRVNDEDWKVYDKTLSVSMIASDKVHAPGHALRHEIAKVVEGVDLWGSGYKRFDSKLDPLKDYMFSIAIMNFKIDNFWTEVLTDCLAVGTMPLFYGADNIGEYFNLDGIITFNNMEEFQKIKLSKELYIERLDAIKENFEIAKLYNSTDDLLADSIIDAFGDRL